MGSLYRHTQTFCIIATALLCVGAFQTTGFADDLDSQENSQTQQAVSCEKALQGSAKLSLKFSEAQLEKLFQKELAKEELRHGPVRGWARPFYWFFDLKKRLYRRLNHKHLNYSYFDETRVDAEILVNPVIQNDIESRKE